MYKAGIVTTHLYLNKMKKISPIIFSFFFLLTACNTPSPEAVKKVEGEGGATTEGSGLVKPSGEAPKWAGNISREMLAVIEQLDSFNDKPIPSLPAAAARKNHTLTDAALALMLKNKVPAPELLSDTTGTDIKVLNGKIHLRIYTPKHGKSPFPVIVYYHGGGFVLADLDVYDASARALSEKANAVVISVAYRLAPEFKFPSAHEDAYAAYSWAISHTGMFNGDPKMIAVAGESAGANLAANVSITAREKGIMMPVHQLLIYPVAGTDVNTASYLEFAAAKPLNRDMMQWFFKQYLNNDQELKSPVINLLTAKLDRLPPTTIITAGLDPLRTEALLLAERLKEADVKVTTEDYPELTHDFFGLGAIVPQALQAQIFAGTTLKKAFSK